MSAQETNSTPLKKRSKLPPSIVRQPALVLEVVKSLEQFPVVLVRGNPLSGKSTFLSQIEEQIGEQPNRTIHSIEFRQDVDLNFALQKIASTLGVSSTADALDTSALLLEENILEQIESSSSILFIDGLQRIRGADKFFEFVVKNIRQGSIVFSSSTIPDVDPLIATDFKLFQYSGFSQVDLEKFLENLSIKVSNDSDYQKTIERLLMSTGGNPFLVKLAVSPAILENRNLSLSDIDANTRTALHTYFDQILKSLDEEKIQILQVAAPIEISTLLEDKVLARLDRQTQLALISVGCLSRAAGSLQMSAPFRTYLIEKIGSDIAKFRDRLIADLENASQLSDIEEKVIQLDRLDRLPEAAALFSEHCDKISQAGNILKIKLMTDRTWAHISIDAFNVRRRVLVQVKMDSGIISECKFRIAQTSDRNDLAQLYYVASRYQLDHDRFAEALHYAKLSKSYISTDDVDQYLLCLAVEMDSLRFAAPQDALRICGEVESTLDSDSRLKVFTRASSTFSVARVLIDLGYFDRASTRWREAAALYASLGNRQLEISAKLNEADALADAGQLEVAAQKANDLVPLYRRHGMIRSLQVALELKVRCFLHLGQTEAARKTLAEIRVLGESEEWLHLDYAIQENLLCIEIKNGNLLTAQKIALLMRAQPVVQSNPNWRFLAEDVESAIQMQPRPKIYGRETTRSLQPQTVALAGILRFEIAWLGCKGIESDLQSLIEDLEARARTPRPYHAQLATIEGLALLFDSKFGAAKSKLVDALNLNREMGMHLWEGRANLGLAILALHSNELNATAGLLNQAESSLKKTDGTFDSDLLHFVYCLYSIRSGTTELFHEHFENLSDNTSLRTGFKFIEGLPLRISDSPISKSIVFSEHQKKFITDVLRLSGLQTSATYRLDTRSKSTSLSDSKAAESFSSKLDFTFNVDTNALTLGNMKIDFSDRAVMRTLLFLFLEYPNKAFSKEELITRVWAETYNPIVHDTRIYTTIKRLRDLVEGEIDKTLIDTIEGRYRLSKSINFGVLKRETEKSQQTEAQRWILKYLRSKGSIDRPAVEKALKMSRTPAMKEINSLIKSGMIRSEGQGKAIRYILV